LFRRRPFSMTTISMGNQHGPATCSTYLSTFGSLAGVVLDIYSFFSVGKTLQMTI
jgi:hypothetical protein